MTLEEIIREEEACVFPEFSNADAFKLGCLVVALAKEGFPKGIAVSIEYDEYPLFTHLMEGTDAHNVYWLNAKRNTVRHFNHSSLYLKVEYALKGQDFNLATGLPQEEYRASGGSVPLVVKGRGRVGTVTVSGLTGEEDHALAIDSITRYLSGERAP